MSSLLLNNTSVDAASERCFHCGDALRGQRYTAVIDSIEQDMCCIGCQAAAEMIQSAGMGDFYRQRESSPEFAQRAAVLDEQYWREFDKTEVAETFISYQGDIASASIEIKQMYCSACAWLIERSYQHVNGIKDLAINLSQKRIRISWDQQQLSFSEVLLVLARLGYQPAPLSALSHGEDNREEHMLALKRIAVAGLGMMQVMGYAFGLYADELSGLSSMAFETEYFLNLISMLVTTAVVFYAGAPFFQNAVRDIRSRHLGMDVPVALAIGGAYSASVWNTLSKNGHTVYFDSAVMFVFFLSLGRFFEMRIRHMALSSNEALSQVLPPLVKLRRNDQLLTLPPHQLKLGDEIELYAGDTVPCDGEIISGSGLFDESLLSGEAKPQRRNLGAAIVGGTKLSALSSDTSTDKITMIVNRQGQDTALAHIGKLLDKARSQRPQQAQLADLIARYFVLCILALTSIVGLVWWQIDSERALSVVLSVLVVTCPCALSLATPAAITAVSHYLSRKGIVLTNSNVLEVLPNIDYWCFDKTGTLTEGRMSIETLHTMGKLSSEQCLGIAASLEQDASHPIADAFQRSVKQVPLQVEQKQQIAGKGVSGVIEGSTYYLGSWEWINQLCGNTLSFPKEGAEYSSVVALSNGHEVLAYFWLNDQSREDASGLLYHLQHQLNTQVSILSGDNHGSVKHLADQLEVHNYRGNLLPEDKVSILSNIQNKHHVAMVGDGINDAPTLAKADVSVTLSNSSQLAQSHADVILLNNQLSSLQLLIDASKNCLSVIKQNMSWAVLYNLSALPMAAMGLLSPWMAALGMSFSSLLVVINASRLNRNSRRHQ